MLISLCWNPQLSDAVTECKDLEALTKAPSYARVILSEIPVLRHRIGKMQLFLCFLKKISFLLYVIQSSGYGTTQPKVSSC